ncbi:MAG: DUF11 domain-containing protein [Chloroflexi bacterium]|nr:DUF11 domain-containing protein [Chloroflexota bacterium]
MNKRSWLFILPFVMALTALALMLTTISWAKDVLPTTFPTRPNRPHDPFSGVYTMYDTLTPSDVPTASYRWIEIHGNADYVWDLGGRNSGSSDASDPYPIGFFFPFYEDFYTHFRISEKGYIFFEKLGVPVGSGGGRPSLIPTNNITGADGANNFIAPFAAHLYGYPEISHVYIRNDSKPRRTIIEFEDLVWCCGLYNPRSFQIMLYPSGDIEMQYRKISNFAGDMDQDLNRTVIVGLENLDASAGDVYTQGLFNPGAADFWQDRMAIRFVPNFSGTQAIFLPSSQSIWDDPGNSITTTSALYLGASKDITRSFRLTHTMVVSSDVSAADWANGIDYPLFVPPITGTYSSTVQFVVSIPSIVADVNDLAIITFTAQSTDTTPYISATFTLQYGPAHRDLQIEKTLDPDIPPADGGALSYRLEVVNTNLDNSDRAAVAHGVVVTDLLPEDVTYEDCHRYPHYHSCRTWVTTITIGNRTLITVDLGTMDIDENETIWLELRNSTGVGSLINNTAHVTTTQNVELGYGPNNHDSISFTVASSQTDLHIRKHFPHWYNNRHYVAAGQAIPFDIYFYNDGDDDGTGNVPLYAATLVDLLPENTTFDHADIDYDGPELVLGVEGPITPTSVDGPMSRTLTFDIPFVDNGWWNEARIRIWINVPYSVPLGTRLTNVVTISHGSDRASDSETVEISSNYVDPFVDKEPSKDAAENVIMPGPGQDYTYWIYYGNRSMLVEAMDIILTDTLPYSVTLVSASATPYLTGPVSSILADGRTQLTWYPVFESDSTLRMPVPPGWEGQIALVVHIDENVPAGTNLVNQVAITYSGVYTPSTLVDDTDVVTVEVISDLGQSQKLVDNPAPGAGESVEYTLAISNTSLTNTINFTVSDVLPTSLSYLGHNTPAEGTVTIGPNSILWMGKVSPTSKVTLAFRAAITDVAFAGQSIRNTAYISSNNIHLERWRNIVVARGVLDDSSKTVSAAAAIASGDTITYTITARNDGSTSRAITITDSLPPAVTLIDSSFNSTAGTAVLPPGNIRAFTWTISVDGMSSESLSFQVTVTDGLTTGVTITNVAYLDDGFAPTPLSLVGTFTIGKLPGNSIYLPLVLRNY